MAEPTIKDVLDAIASIRGEMGTMRAELATTSDLARLESKLESVESKVDAHRAETAKRFDDIDAELAKHADPVHRKLEEDVATLKKLVAAKKAAARPVARRPRRG